MGLTRDERTGHEIIRKCGVIELSIFDRRLYYLAQLLMEPHPDTSNKLDMFWNNLWEVIPGIERRFFINPNNQRESLEMVKYDAQSMTC
jgi:hypothetical protein